MVVSRPTNCYLFQDGRTCDDGIGCNLTVACHGVGLVVGEVVV